jgi:hypothetical protein
MTFELVLENPIKLYLSNGKRCCFYMYIHAASAFLVRRPFQLYQVCGRSDLDCSRRPGPMTIN